MRTTLEIDDYVLAVARTLSREQGRSLGSIVSELAHRGLVERHSTSTETGLPTFDVRPDSPPITTEMVLVALDEVSRIDRD